MLIRIDFSVKDDIIPETEFIICQGSSVKKVLDDVKTSHSENNWFYYMDVDGIYNGIYIEKYTKFTILEVK